MRILDMHDRELFNPDLELGYLQDAKILIAHHPAVEAVEEQGHYEVIARYPNGGKDVEWVVDVPKVDAVEAWDEYEDILRYVEYTAEELAERKAAEEAAYRKSYGYRVAQLEEALELLLSGVTE